MNKILNENINLLSYSNSMLLLENTELYYSNSIAYKSVHLFPTSYNVGLCSIPS